MSKRFPPAFMQFYRRALEEIVEQAVEEHSDTNIRRSTLDAYVRVALEMLDKLDDADLEPSLGSLEQHHWYDSQEQWAGGITDERELDNADLENGGDDEPSLGWTVDQSVTDTGIFNLDGEEDRV